MKLLASNASIETHRGKERLHVQQQETPGVGRMPRKGKQGYEQGGLVLLVIENRFFKVMHHKHNNTEQPNDHLISNQNVDWHSRTHHTCSTHHCTLRDAVFALSLACMCVHAPCLHVWKKRFQNQKYRAYLLGKYLSKYSKKREMHRHRGTSTF